MFCSTLTLLLTFFFVFEIDGKCLVREPPDTFAPPQETDAGFYLSVNGNPEFYEAGQLYTVTLRVS